MLKITEIFKSWATSINPTPEEKKIAYERMIICNECPSKKFLKNFNIYVCGECNCPLQAKIFSPLSGKEACPLKKW